MKSLNRIATLALGLLLMLSCNKEEEFINGGVRANDPNDFRNTFTGSYLVSCSFTSFGSTDYASGYVNINRSLASLSELTLDGLAEYDFELEGDYDLADVAVVLSADRMTFTIPNTTNGSSVYVGNGSFGLISDQVTSISYSYTVNPGADYPKTCSCQGNKF